MRLEAIISGGQSGADTGGLFAGSSLGIATGGIAPSGWKTENGPAPWLADYGLEESDLGEYIDRTIDNLTIADGTVIFGKRSPGSNRTEELCRVKRKPCLWIWYPEAYWLSFPVSYEQKIEQFHMWLSLHEIKVLNVAGNRESVNPGICSWVQGFLEEALDGR